MDPVLTQYTLIVGARKDKVKTVKVGIRASSVMMNENIRRCSGRPIPKRGQVKVGIVVGLANSVASIFSRNRAR
ncbi:hypothetical protein Lal_00026367 [Lupinus albus]|nr:hypothetical protein Lal_00026367 [Lupinus albus]